RISFVEKFVSNGIYPVDMISGIILFAHRPTVDDILNNDRFNGSLGNYILAYARPRYGHGLLLALLIHLHLHMPGRAKFFDHRHEFFDIVFIYSVGYLSLPIMKGNSFDQKCTAV